MTTSTSNFFAQADPKFLPPPADGRVETLPFLQASKQMLPFFDMLGTAFKPVKSDIDGNINKIQKKYKTDPEKFQTLEDMLKDDIENKNTRHNESATVGLLWLKRALQLITGFLEQVVADHRSGQKTENLVQFVNKAYEQSLKRYHGWIVQKIFGLVARATPWRRDFLKTLANGNEGMDDQVINDMEEFVFVLSGNIQVIQDMYTQLDLDFSDKV